MANKLILKIECFSYFIFSVYFSLKCVSSSFYHICSVRNFLTIFYFPILKCLNFPENDLKYFIPIVSYGTTLENSESIRDRSQNKKVSHTVRYLGILIWILTVSMFKCFCVVAIAHPPYKFTSLSLLECQ